MTKSYQTIILLITTLCLFFIIQTAQSAASKKIDFKVEGQVYCDPCRAGFITKLSTFLKGATVRLECKGRDHKNNKTTFSGEATTDDTGTYHLNVTGDHEADICEIKLVKSPDPQCSEINTKKDFEDVARVSLTTNSGMVSTTRKANSIGFMKKEVSQECQKLLYELRAVPQK